MNVYRQVSKIDNKAAKQFRALSTRFMPPLCLRFFKTNKWTLERNNKTADLQKPAKS